MTRVTLVLALLAGLLVVAAGRPDSGVAAIPPPIVTSRTAGGGVGTVIWEKQPRADGYIHADTPAMIERIKRLGVNHYTYSMWQTAKDWDDFRLEFAPAARELGIKLWVYLVPPSECVNQDKPPEQRGRCSHPYQQDYQAWAKAIATLSLEYPNLTGWAIDDLLVSAEDRAAFSPANLKAIRAAEEAVNPNLEMYAVLYHHQIMTDADLDWIKESVDGVIYPYLGHASDTVDASLLETRVDQALAKLQPRGLKLMLLVYASRILSGPVHPQGAYLTEVLRRAKPYLLDGRLSGVMSYGTQMRHELHQPAREHLARTGLGRLSLSVSPHTQTPAGSYAEAAQVVPLDPAVATKKLTIRHHDQYEATLRTTGHQILQVLLDGTVVWHRDLATDARNSWLPTTLDLSRQLAGKSSVRLALRLQHPKGVTNYPLDLSIDDLTATGFAVADGGFEQPGRWQLRTSHPGLQPLVDVFAADRPVEIYNAIGAGFADILGRSYDPVPRRAFPDLRLGPTNRAMSGNSRLEVALPRTGATIVADPAHTKCGWAAQKMRVQPAPRYQLSFWSADTVDGKWNDYLFKSLWIDNDKVRRLDVNDATRLSPSSSSRWGSTVSTSAIISPKRWSRSQGTAVNWTRCVSSCKHTHSRKSDGSASSWRSTCTMFGATSNSRPCGSENGSNCPRTRDARKPSSAPTSAPVTREPMACVIPLGGPFFAASFAATGSMIFANPSALAWIQAGRSMTSTGAVSGGASSPV